MQYLINSLLQTQLREWKIKIVENTSKVNISLKSLDDIFSACLTSHTREFLFTSLFCQFFRGSKMFRQTFGSASVYRLDFRRRFIKIVYNIFGACLVDNLLQSLTINEAPRIRQKYINRISTDFPSHFEVSLIILKYKKVIQIM